jgi:hypothetical protein
LILESLGNIGDFVCGLGVVLTLAYIEVQIRQNTATTRVQTVQHLLTTNSESINAMIGGPVPAIVSKLESGEELSETELAIYRIYLRGHLTEQLQIFYQLQKKMIEPEIALPLQHRLILFMQSNVARVIWNERLRSGFPAEFQEHVDQQLSHQA